MLFLIILFICIFGIFLLGTVWGIYIMVAIILLAFAYKLERISEKLTEIKEILKNKEIKEITKNKDEIIELNKELYKEKNHIEEIIEISCPCCNEKISSKEALCPSCNFILK